MKKENKPCFDITDEQMEKEIKENATRIANNPNHWIMKEEANDAKTARCD